MNWLLFTSKVYEDREIICFQCDRIPLFKKSSTTDFAIRIYREKKKIHRERIVGFLLLAGVKVKKDITNPKCSWCSDGRVNFITDFIALGSVNRLREFAVLSVLASHHLFHRSLLTQLEKMELPKLS